MLDVHIPDLTFPGVDFGPEETPWDLRSWLYRGGADAPLRDVASLIESGTLGRPLVERIELVRLVRESLLNYLDGGGRRDTVQGCIASLKQFFRWADSSGAPDLSLTTVEQCYRNWCDALLHRARVARTIKEATAYGYGSVVGWVLDRILERGGRIVRTTRLKKQKRSPRALSPKADKQSLQKTFEFGNFLLDLADGLSVNAIWGPLPINIPLRNGKILEEWSGLKRSHTLKSPNLKWPSQARQAARRATDNRAAWEAETTYRTRYQVINLRVLAEMFMLMAQSAINVAQAHQLRMDEWRFKSSNQGYEIRTYKHRRWGPVIFNIYSEYRAIFERYLQWRKAIFPDDPHGLLFPLFGIAGRPPQRRSDKPPNFDPLRRACKRAGITYVTPQTLRNTNANWMLRRTGDPELTADEKQHAKETLLGVYEKPSLQRAMVETQIFWAKYDPALAAAGPGHCANPTPEPTVDMPTFAPEPDCITPAGCLFCTHQRDIDSLDYVWSLASFGYLKSLELRAHGQSGSTTPFVEPSDLTLDRITAKLNFIRDSSPERAEWVKEAKLRLEEGCFHPAWSEIIESLWSTSAPAVPGQTSGS